MTLLPPLNHRVLALVIHEGKRQTIIAQYAGLHTLPSLDGYCGCGDCPDDDVSYCPKGWYETNLFEDTHWKVEGDVIDWQELPEWPKEGA